MLFSSSDEDARALLEQYKELKEKFEKNLIMLHVKTEGKLTLDNIYSMTYKMRELAVESYNEYSEELEKKYKNNS